ncbi:MAG: DUF11 domain-containing protein, partial [Thermotogae bacterium]|nr:DUF11 domain-containing protein [Thermotogota bacterium]
MAMRFLKLKLAVIVFASFVIAAELTPAGTVIRNQASAKVGDEVYLSNVVETVVQPICYPLVLPDGTPDNPGQRLTTVTGGYAVLPYTLMNAGNDVFEFSVNWEVSNLSDWISDEVQIYLDTNRNGSLDPGEKEINALNIAAGETVGILLMVKTPSNSLGSAFYNVVLTCSSGTKDSNNYSEITLIHGAALNVEKYFRPPQIVPGEVTEVTLRVQNVGDLPVGREVVLSDDLSILEGFSYVPGSASAPKGTIEFYDGDSWTVDEPAT